MFALFDRQNLSSAKKELNTRLQEKEAGRI